MKNKSNNDIFTDPIDFALDEIVKKFENSEEKHEKIIHQSLIRSREMWKNIRINGLEIYGMTFEKFCGQFENKRNVIFLTDEELEKYKKALKIMDLL